MIKQWIDRHLDGEAREPAMVHEIKELRAKLEELGVQCSDHPDAPHGFDRTSSHSLGRYVCVCEGWAP